MTRQPTCTRETGRPSADLYQDDGTPGTDRILATGDGTTIVIGPNSSFSGIETIDAGGHSGVTIQTVGSEGLQDFSAIKLVGIARIVDTRSGDGLWGSASNDIIDGSA